LIETLDITEEYYFKEVVVKGEVVSLHPDHKDELSVSIHL